MAKSKSHKSSSAQRATASQQSSAAQRSSTQQAASTQKSTTQQSAAQKSTTEQSAVQKPAAVQSVSAGQKTSAAQRREAQRQQQMASAERSRAKTRGTHGGSRGRKQSSPAVSPIVWVAVALLVVIAAVGIFFYLSKQPSSSSSTIAINGRKPAPASVVNEVTNISPSILQAVDIGKVQTTPIPLSGQPPLTGSVGKPEFFYYGAEYCPYCAAQRWSMLVALSRFGTFKNLSITTSSATDVYPSTPTFSFYGSSYSSPYIDFVPVETTTNQPDSSGGYVTLETPNAQEQQLVTQYDAPPYTSQSGSFPFVDIANKYLMIGPGYSPQLLQSENWQQIASALKDPSSQIAQGVIGTANYLTAAICMSSNQQPASVCQAAPIPAIETALNKTSFNAGSSQLATIGSAPVAYVKRQD